MCNNYIGICLDSQMNILYQLNIPQFNNSDCPQKPKEDKLLTERLPSNRFLY